MGKLSYVIATALIGLATNAFAVNVADVYQAAVENDPVLGAAKQEYAARGEVVPQTRAGLLPSINLNASTAYNRTEYPNGEFIDTDPSSPTFGQLRGINGQDYNTNSWQAQLVQPIIDVAAYYTYRSAQALKAQAKQDYVGSEQNLIVRTIDAYLDVLRSQERNFGRASNPRRIHLMGFDSSKPLLQAIVPQNAQPERRDLWHEPWAFALVVVLLSAEWMLRRRWGLR